MTARALTRLTLLLIVLSAAGCSLGPRTPQPRRGMVVTADSLASSIGRAILEKGGNAVDAAVAVGFALAVAYPEAGNIGGGGFMLLRMPDGSSQSIDFRETAPRRSTPGMFLAGKGGSVDGCLAPAVPGTVAGLLTALERYGTMERAGLLSPSIALSEQGFVVNEHLAASLFEYRGELERSPTARRLFFRDGATLSAGDTLTQPELGSTLRRIADSGMGGFYAGRTASLIARHMAACGGLIDADDLSGYRALVRPAQRGAYRGYTIDAMGPPSSGGLCLLQALSLLEPFDLRSLGSGNPGSIHLVAEAMKRAFSMRAAYLGDPDFIDVPVARLLGAVRGLPPAHRIDSSRAVPADSLAGFPGIPREGTQTTHYSIIDGDGMAVAVTYTLNDLFGNKDVVEGAGFFLNDQMDDFVTVPGQANLYGLVGGPENKIAPRKRPLSSMSPTIVSNNGVPVFILGARGGAKIISAVLQAIINVVDYGMPPDSAIALPRFHHQWSPDTLVFERGAIGPGAREELIRRGHSLREINSTIGQIQAIYVDPETGLLTGVPDRREGGAADGF